MIIHFTYNVISDVTVSFSKSQAFEKLESSNHPSSLKPVLIGSIGLASALLSSTDTGDNSS